MTYDWVAENARRNAENERRQEQLRQERMQREILDLQRRQTAALERQAHHSHGILGLVLLGLIIAGLVWAVLWFVGVVWRVGRRKNESPTTPTDHENELLGLLRRHDVDPDDVAAGVRETLRRQAG